MNDNKIDSVLNQLKNDSAKLLYLINYIFEKENIDMQQKRKLKEQICQNNPMVFNLLNNSKDINKFIESAKLIAVYGDITKDQTKSTVHKALISSLCQNQIQQNEVDPDDLKSPQGTMFVNIKKKRQKKK